MTRRTPDDRQRRDNLRAETNQFAQEADYDPSAGGVGFLTFDEYDRLVRAVSNAKTHVAWWKLAGHIRLGDAEEQRSRSSDPMIPLPATWLAAEEISNLLSELNTVPTLEDAAAQLPEIAMTLTREVETAMAKWPMSDRPHKVRYLRCRACQQQTLKYYPPSLRGPADSPRTTVHVRQTRKVAAVEVLPVADVLDINVKCTNPECRAVEDPALFERDALLIRLEHDRAKSRGLDSAGRRTRKSGPRSGDDLQVGGGGADSDGAPVEEAVAVSP